MNKQNLFFGVVLVAFLGGCTQTQTPSQPQTPTTPVASAAASDDDLHKLASSLFAPLPEVMSEEPLDEEMVELGRMLYYDKRLSKDKTMSCNTCHDLKKYGVDGEPTSLGVTGQRGARNSPTVYNAAVHISQFWDGRSPDVEDQAKGPVMDPVEMAMPSEEEVAKRLREVPEYRERFAKLFPDEEEPETLDNAAKAIGAFERGLVTHDRFDDYLEGDLTALEMRELIGLKTFIEVGCASCHSGAALGGGQYQKLGLLKPFDTEDFGRYDVTGKESDKHNFKVPSLRNIHETGPYYHDGSIADLHEAIHLMAEHQLNKTLTDEEVAQIADFLGCLTGEIPHDYIAEPDNMPE